MVLNTLSKVFKRKGNELYVIIKNGDYFFKAKDVCDALGYDDPASAIRRLVPSKYKKSFSELRVYESYTLHPQTIFVSEPGLYELIFSSRLPVAIEFKEWVFEKVLPSLRKKGYRDDRVPRDFKVENEKDLHNKVVDFIRKRHPELMMIAGLGENQINDELRLSSYLKGYTKGQPDLIISNYHKDYTGFCIELKTPKGNGELSPAQKEVLEDYEDNGYKVLISHDYDEIIEELIEYSKDLRYPCGKCSKKFRSRETLRKHKEGFRH